MTRIALAVLAFVTFLPAPALAAPNDFRVVSGTLLHPVRLGSDAAVAVLQGDEGTVYYADLRAVSVIPTLQRGAAVTLVGFEGSRPDQLAAQAIYPSDLTPAPADAPSARSERVDGRIESLAGDTVVLVRSTDGHDVMLLLRGVSINIRDLLQRGDEVTVFGQPSETDFVVTGIIQRQDCCAVSGQGPTGSPLAGYDPPLSGKAQTDQPVPITE
jgi:hypothetical protein